MTRRTTVSLILFLVGLLLLLIPAIYVLLAVIPMPLFLYPRWAREIVPWRRQNGKDVRARRR